ncbi:hypothetical protein J7L87_00680 [bacterium]|nr:hypothetical protein [bacterium]
MFTKEKLKEVAKNVGVDLIGVGDINLFDGFPPEKDPRYIFPDARVIIGLGFRILKGSFRGVIEKTHYYQLMTMGVGFLEEVYIPVALHKIARFIEDNGYEAVVQRSIPDRRTYTDKGTNPERTPIYKIKARPMSPEKPAPDVIFDFKVAAYICGLGEIGYGGFFLTPQFGPLQRFGFILTDTPLSPDPLFEGKLCKGKDCMECIKACPCNAIGPEEKTIKIGNNTITYAKLDEWRCALCYSGACKEINPFLPPDFLKNYPNREKLFKGEYTPPEDESLHIINQLGNQYPGQDGYNPCICGRRCWLACLKVLFD